MLAATILHSLSAVCVLLIVIGFGVFLARKGWFDAPSHRGIVSKLVNAALPCFLFYSVISKFSHGELYNLLKFAGLPFLTVGLNFLISVLFIKLGWVRPHMKGTFIAAFTGATVLFVGVFNIQLDGARRGMTEEPKIFSVHGLKMLLSPPLMGFLIGLIVVLLSIPVPKFISQSTHTIGQLATPLALVFVGITVWQIGFEKLKKLPREVWLILLSCYVIRPITMYLCTMPLDMDPLMRKCFILASALPVSSVIAVLSKAYGGDEEFASEAVGASTVAMIFVLPFLLIAVNLVN